MKVGYAQNIITPSVDRPVFLAGFGNDRRAKSVHDDLTVRALAIQSNQTTLVLTAIDLIGLFNPDIEDVREALGISETFQNLNPHVIIASTHTHHGPDTAGLWGPNMKTRGVDTTYMSTTREKIAQTILSSLVKLRPCEGMKATSVQVPGLVKNARNPEILDDELTLLQFVGQNGIPLVTLFNFPCHPEVLWEHNPHISADYPGSLRDEVERQTGAPCIFFSGALGGMMTPDVKNHSFEECEAMGKKLAEEGLKALGAVSSDQLSLISVLRKEIKVKLTNILYKIAFRLKLLPDVRDRKGYVTTEVNLVRIGDLWFAGVPGELLPKLGLQLKAWMKESGANVTGVLGLANGWFGYIIPVEDFKYPWNPFKPGEHYEETNSIGKGIASSVMDGIKNLTNGGKE